MVAPEPPVRLRSGWQTGDADLIVDLHRRGYANEGPAFEGGFLDFVRATVEEAALGAPGHKSRVWFAERGEETLGCAAMIDRGARGQLRWVVLLPEARGTGLGKTLLITALAHAESSGWDEVYLETTRGLTASMQLYLTHGFTVVRDEEARLWNGPGHEVVMVRRI